MAAGRTMPIRELTLFNNGYGVFERQTSVSGRGNIDLLFRDGEIQDVLQSLCFTGGSHDVGNISYESTKPQPSIRLDDSTPLVSLLHSLRGSHVALLVRDDKAEEGSKETTEVAGQILGVDSKLFGKVEGYFLTMLVSEGCVLKTIPLSEIMATKLLEGNTKEDLQHALDHAQTEKKPDMQKLTIFYKGATKKNPLTVKYGLHVAEWKSSYRLMFLDESGRFRLDGLAIVKNTQEEDWNDIGLTLVVGNPKIVQASSSKKGGASSAGRMSLEIRPVEGRGGSYSVNVHPGDSIFALKQEITRLKGIPVFEQRLIYAGKEVGDGRSLADYNITSGSCLRLDRRATKHATASSEYDSEMMKRKFIMAQQDGLSYYPIKSSVSAKRNQTAIVPLMQAELEGQLVTIYDDSVRKGNPLAAVLFENTTGLTLEQGTLQVMNEKIFLGEGSLPGLGIGDESAPIPYAVEMGVEVSISHVQKRHHAHEVKMHDGSIFLYYYRQQTSKYSIKNMTARKLDFMLNHTFLDAWELYDHEDEGVQPVDITDRVYRFRFDVPARTEKEGSGAQATEMEFPVREQIISVKNINIGSMSREELTTLVSKGTVPEGDPIIGQLEETMKLRDRYDTFLRMINEKEAELREVKDAQSRLREHIRSLTHFERESKRYVKSLADEEDKLTGIDAEIKALKNDKKAEKRRHVKKIDSVKYHRKDIPAPRAK
eukprot:scpid30370/ scgid22317/ Polyubiquitin; Ubiquitin